jgi:Tol biopolymer transport system component
LAALSCCLVLAGSSDARRIRPADSRQSAGSIAFIAGTGMGHCNAQQQVSIDVINADGTGLKQLVRGADTPRWSPDGRRIAFDRRCSGLHVERVTRLAGAKLLVPSALRASWAPTGSFLAVEGVRFGNGIATVAVAGGVATPITHGQARLGDAMPSWSPDGNSIAFVRDHASIGLVNPDGSGERTLVSQDGLVADAPAWSPDGRLVAFPATVDSQNNTERIDVIAPDGRGRRALWTPELGDFGQNIRLAWSPDGTKLAFTSDDNRGGYDLYVINRDGSGLRDVAAAARPNAPEARSFDWSPDSRRLVVEIVSDLWILSLDGRPRLLVSAARLHASSLLQPRWNPAGLRTNAMAGTSLTR